MINILKFPYTPKACCWVHEPGAGQTLLAVSDVGSTVIRIYDGRGDGQPLFELDKLHRSPVHLMVVSTLSLARIPDIHRLCSTRPDMIASSRRTRRDSWSTGNLASHGDCLHYLDCGSTNPPPICITSKR